MTDNEKMALLERIANGAHISNFIMDNHGTMTIHNHADRQAADKPEVTEEQIARAIMALNGKNNVINSQRAWLGACCLLGWKYGFPRNLGDCCRRIESLPLDHSQLEFQCKYGSLREYGSWKFVKEDANNWPTYTPRDDERPMFEKSLAVAQALDKEIMRQTEP